MAMHVPGWPEFAACTASIDSVRMVLMAICSMLCLSVGVNTVPPSGCWELEGSTYLGEIRTRTPDEEKEETKANPCFFGQGASGRQKNVPALRGKLPASIAKVFSCRT